MKGQVRAMSTAGLVALALATTACGSGERTAEEVAAEVCQLAEAGAGYQEYAARQNELRADVPREERRRIADLTTERCGDLMTTGFDDRFEGHVDMQVCASAREVDRLFGVPASEAGDLFAEVASLDRLLANHLDGIANHELKEAAGLWTEANRRDDGALGVQAAARMVEACA